jgi:hypothetical protein
VGVTTPYVGPVIGAAIGAAVAYVVGEAINWLRSAWVDDIFPPQTVAIQISSINARWAGSLDSGDNVITFKGHDGTYQVSYDWRLVIDWRTDGVLVKGSGPAVYLMQAHQRRWIPNPDTFNFMKLDWNVIQVVVNADLEGIPRGPDVPSRANGALMRGSGPAVYWMQGGLRRWIPDPDTFNAMRLNWNAIQAVSDADLEAVPRGQDVPSVRLDVA